MGLRWLLVVLVGCGAVKSPKLEISPGTDAVPPGGVENFIAGGGSPPYAFTLTKNASGGEVIASTGSYHAGRTGGVTDEVTVTDASGQSASAGVDVQPAISIMPDAPITYPGESLAFTATGGSHSGYFWMISSNASGATIDASSGMYQAGTVGSVHDVVTVTDDLGNTAMRMVDVRALHLYIGDSANHRIVRLDHINGAGFVAFGAAGTGPGQFGRPMNVFADTAGKIYVADQTDFRIARIDNMAGANFVAFGTQGTGVGQFAGPTGVTVDANGKIYVADFSGNRIVRMDDMAGTNFVAFGTQGAGVGQFSGPTQVVIGDDGKIYICEQINSRISRIDDMAGTNFVSFGTRGANVGQFADPDGMAIAGGKIYVADTGNSRIVRIDDMAGTGYVTFGTSGTGAGQFSTPTGIALDALGRIYVGEYGNNRIDRMTTFMGTGFTSFGVVGAGNGQFSAPYGMFVR